MIAYYSFVEVKSTSIVTNTGFSKSTLQSILKKINNILTPSEFGREKIDGPNIIVEIDESKFGKVK